MNDIQHSVQEAQEVKMVSLSELSEIASGPKMFEGKLSIIAGVKVEVEVLVGAAEMSVQDLFALQKGSVVALKQHHNEPIVVRLEGKPIALGTLVVVDENFGVCITEILSAINEIK
jgi:flagellar motor switch protein FliN/FliY